MDSDVEMHEPAPVAPRSPTPPPPRSPTPPPPRSPSPPLVAPVPLNGVPRKQDNPLITALPPLPPPPPSPVFNEPHLPLQPLTFQAKTEILDHAVPLVKVNGHQHHQQR
ncbi:hypothetical protein H0H92_014501 [Tricholoma furcatifolium]|nr:hypothetical protein H0H92_014501 [Tricholoma furcatifolium]